MKIVALACLLTLVACTTSSDVACQTDDCECPLSAPCQHTCAEGGPECHVECAAGQACDVTCEMDADCHVEGNEASSVMVDCGSSGDCHVTCPMANCTVTNCSGTACVVSCGLLGTVATRNGTTATCP